MGLGSPDFSAPPLRRNGSSNGRGCGRHRREHRLTVSSFAPPIQATYGAIVCVRKYPRCICAYCGTSTRRTSTHSCPGNADRCRVVVGETGQAAWTVHRERDDHIHCLSCCAGMQSREKNSPTIFDPRMWGQTPYLVSARGARTNSDLAVGSAWHPG